MARPKVFVTRKIPHEALDIVASACDFWIWDAEDTPVPREVLLREIGGVDGVLTTWTEKIDEEFLNAAPTCKVIASFAVGYDNIDIPLCTSRKVLVTNTPGVLTETSADLIWALMMAASRRIVEAQKYIEEGAWESWSPTLMMGQDIYGATLGVVGPGRVGSAVIRRAKGFNMKVLYNNPVPMPQLEAETGAQFRRLDDMLRESDFVVVTVPLTQQTRGMFGAREFALMKPTSVFVNTCRGQVVREIELYEALKKGRPWAAGLDVYEREPIGPNHPLLTLPNVVCLPHIASASFKTRT
ncbi:MAG TPA: D-glycerate dehydrogenase, partial [Symbiobacteriaceae bacterium]|nr:D-glycerate dehydrogenase [Symbiobacteriaceae bacterium]